MSIANFVPEFWSARLLRHLDSRLVFAGPQLANRDWEGEISDAGDTVHIQRVGDPTVKARTKYTDIDAPQQPTGATTALVVDQDWYFNVSIDDVDAWQANVDLLDRFAERAGRAMSTRIDASVAAVMVAGAGINVATDGTPATVGNDAGDDYTFYSLLVEARRQLNNNDAPADGRWAVIPPDVEAVALDDPRFVVASPGMGDDIARSGLIGRIAGFDVLVTTAAPDSPGSGGTVVPNWKVLFGAGNYATTYAGQATKMEAYRPESRFEDAVKGMQVWGSKVVEAETLGVAHVAK